MVKYMYEHTGQSPQAEQTKRKHYFYNTTIVSVANKIKDIWDTQMAKKKDFNTTPEISERMARIKSKNGPSETQLAKALWQEGIRYRKNYKKLPGSPDIAITSKRIAIFVDGELWHGFDWENSQRRFKANREYWLNKIEKNMERDKRNDALLHDMGWLVLHFWDAEVKKHLDQCVKKVLLAVESQKFYQHLK